MQLKAILLSAVVAMVLLSPVIEANSNGIHNSSGGCGCHGGSTSSLAISENFPSSYVAGQSYSIQVSVSGGVSGTKGGFNVEVSKGTLATGGSTSVKVSGTSITHTNNANRAWTFDWTAPSAGSGSVVVDIAGMAANGGSGNNGDSWSTTSLTITETVVATNNPPTVTDVQISPVAATSSDDITLTYTFSDQDSGDTESGTTIHWSKNGVHQTQFDGLLTISSDDITRGDDWQASVTPSDGQDFGTSVNSNTITVLNSLPSISSTAISPSNPTSDDDLTTSIAGDEDNDGDSLTFEYRWYVGSVLQDGLNNLTTLPSIVTRAGDSWEVEIRAFDGEGHSAWVRSNAISIEGQPNTVPTVDSITISPTNPTTSDSLIASSTSSDADMDSITDTEYRWWKNGVMTAISSSMLESTTTTKGDVWVVEVRVNDGTDWSTWTPSSNIEIQNTAPQLESASISATEVTTDQDVTLSTIMSDVDGDTLTMNIVWDLNGTIQPEYNNQVTLPSSATIKGNIWTAIVQADDGEATSSQSETLSVSILNSKPLLSIALDESVTSQDDLSIETTITDLDGDLTEISSITWFRNGFREGSLDGATTVPSSYLGPGQEWSVEVIATDEEISVLSTGSIIVENAPPSAQITVITDSLYGGERTLLSAHDSTDPDNSIVRYQWIWTGGGASGVEASFLMPLSGSIDVSLTVTDESGATNTTLLTLDSIPALTCPNLTQTVTDQNVRLDWTWGSSETASFEIMRNGVTVGVTNATTFNDKPSLIGTSTYQVQTMLGDRILESSCQSPVVDVVIESSTTDFEQGPSSVAGLGLGSVYAIIGILLFVSSLLRRGE
tara:strand:+ start:6711 stop:9221 length:2511 start_codon:yes stop_codon:yes gene_type:complete